MRWRVASVSGTCSDTTSDSASRRSRSPTHPGTPGVGAGVVEDVHAEAGRATGDGLTDPAEADEPERRAVHVASEVLVDPPAVPAAVAQVGLGVVREA